MVREEQRDEEDIASSGQESNAPCEDAEAQAPEERLETEEAKSHPKKNELAVSEREEENDRELQRWRIHFYKLATFLTGALLVCGSITLCWYFSAVAAIIGYAILLSYLFVGLVDWLQRRTFIKSRLAAVVTVFALVIFLGVLFAFIIVPKLVNQLELLSEQFPLYINKLEGWARRLVERFPGLLPQDWRSITEQVVASLQTISAEVVSQLFSLASVTVNFAVYSLITLVLSVYFLMDGPAIWDTFVRPLTFTSHKDLDNLRHLLNLSLRRYLFGQAQLATLSGLVVFLIYLLMGSKYALLLGLWQALIEIIPIVGGFLGIAIGALVLLLTHPNPWFALVAIVIYLTYTQTIKDNFLTPRIMGDAVGLHPVVVLLVVLIGARLGGVNGVVFSIPIAAIINIVINYYAKVYVPERDRRQIA